jgi:PAS domain S-box-containing protein
MTIRPKHASESTEQAMTEQTQSQDYEYIFRSTSDGILMTGSDGLIERVNPAAAAMLGLTIEELVGKTPTQDFTKYPNLLNLFNRSGDQTLEVRLPRRRLAVGMATTVEDGKRLVLLQDVTEKRELEDRRESLVKAISHDLHNPISAINGFADLIAKFGDLNEQQQKFLTRIRQTGNKLYEVIGPLVDLAWIEAGMPLDHAPIQLSEIVNEVVSELGTLAQAYQITIAFSLQDPTPTVMGDRKRLKMVIYQLLHNAIIYSPPEQSIAIHTWGDMREVYCSVADRGIGIADNELELIFDRMYRSQDEHVRDLPGGGLGLTIARTIIDRHGGDIWATSNYGEGSTFTFVLPAVEQ